MGEGFWIGCSPGRRSGGQHPDRHEVVPAPFRPFLEPPTTSSGGKQPPAHRAGLQRGKQPPFASICVHLRLKMQVSRPEIAIFHRKTAPNGQKTAFSDPFSPARSVAARFRSENRLTPRRQVAKKLLKGRTPLGVFAPLCEKYSGIGRPESQLQWVTIRKPSHAKTRRSF